MPDAVVTERVGAVLVICLNRPEVRNAVNSAVSRAVLDAFRVLDRDPHLNSAVLCGSDPVFSSGMDLKAFATEGVPTGLERLLADRCAKPLVGAIEGAALGGGLELALTCDLLVSASDARFGVPEVSRGLIAAGGGLIRLGQRLPYNVAMQLALTGDSISAAEAHSYGLVNAVTAPGQSRRVALDLATRIARNAPLATAASKRILQESIGLTEEASWQRQRDLAGPVFESGDAAEGARAFAEKRSPQWRGH
jgi:enoyl-CoA hydratase